MKLFLARHGESVTKEVDPDCPLSDRGMEKIKKLASYLGGRGVLASRVVHSGKTRARQTAEILAGAVAPDVEIETGSGLKPMDSPEPIAIKTREWTEDTLLVGHLPFMGKLLSLLAAGNEDADVAAFSAGAIACLERGADGSFTILWMASPESISGV